LSVDTWGTTRASGGVVNNGLWHQGVAVYDPTPTDGLTFKLYVDGRLVGSGASATVTTVLAGAGAMMVARNNSGSNPNFLTGSLDGVFITDYAMAQDEISSLYAKGSLALGVTPMLDDNVGQEIVQGVDATNLYIVGDVRKRIDGKVNGDGTIGDAVGGDFRVVRNGPGNYMVFLPPGFFSSPPVVTVTWIGGAFGDINSLSATNFGVYPKNASNVGTDTAFTFVAEARGPIPSQNQIDLGVQA